MVSKQLFDAAMEQERQYAKMEYAAVQVNDNDGAHAAHAMRWRMMDKAVALLEEK